MEIRINGQIHQLEAPAPKVLDALRLIGLDESAVGVAVALNMELVTKSNWSQTSLQAGDELEVITARQGG